VRLSLARMFLRNCLYRVLGLTGVEDVTSRNLLPACGRGSRSAAVVVAGVHLEVPRFQAVARKIYHASW